MQQEVIAKGLAELFMLLARADAAPSSQGQDQTLTPPPAPASEGLTEGEGAFEQAVGECPCCAAFVGADEANVNLLLDQNRDGNVVDYVVRMLGNFLKR